nr:ribonuclease H-like domain-containing protein [Tanacetum cinerariifolium]
MAEASSHNPSSPETTPKEELVTLDKPESPNPFLPADQVEFSFDEISLTTNNEVALIYPSHSNLEYFEIVSDFISKCCLKKAFTRAPTQYKEYMCEFWYTAKTLDDSKIWVSTPTGEIRGDIGINTFRNALGAHYLPHSSMYVSPPSITIARPCGQASQLLMGQIIQCIGGKICGLDQISNKDATILYCLANGVKVDYAKLIWENIIHKLNKKISEKVVPYPRFISLILEYMMPEYDNEELTINPTQEVPQGKKPRAKNRLKRKQSSKHTSESKTEASKSKTGQSEKETQSSSAKDKSPSHPLLPTLVVDEMHKEAQQAAGGPTSLGATSKEGAHLQLSSGAARNNVPSVGQAFASPAKGEKNTAKDAETNLQNELVDLLGIDMVEQYHNKKLLFDKYSYDTLSRYKARLVANESTHIEGVDDDETFSPVVKPGTIQTVLISLFLDIGRFTSLMSRMPSYMGTDTAYLLVYVDDIILTASFESLLQRIIASLHQEFSLTDLVSPNYFSGAHMVNCNPSRTPIDMESKLGDDGYPISDPTLYLSLAGSLQYLTFTLPDISYAVQQICLYMHDSREPHFSALKLILRYIRGTLDYRLQVFSSSTTSLVSYLDADWAGCPTTRRLTSGYCVFLGTNLLSWSSKRQTTVSRSSVEAKYRGVANAVAETCWLRNLLRELHTPLSSATLVYYDNVSVVYLSSSPIKHQRTKHIEIDIHFV